MDDGELEESEGAISDPSDNSDPGDAMVNLADIAYDTAESREDELADYEMLSPDQLMQHMADITNEVSQIIQVPSTYLRLLLAHFKWDKDALLEFYFEHDRARTFREAKILDVSSLNAMEVGRPKVGASPIMIVANEVLCEICYSSFTFDQMYGLGCGHFFCRGCWQGYLTWKIMEESQSDRIHCPAFNCNALIEDEVVFQMISNLNVRRRFQKLITNSFVLHNRTLTWCTGADCGYAARCFGLHEARQILCTNCSESFCFACGQPWHDPVLCQQLKLWIRKVADDAGTSNWIIANTKECPKCRAIIEKNGGCNHMICKNLDCKYEFCWVCLDRWEPHGSRWYNCNRYDDTASQKARDVQVASRIALERYLFYFNRYANHSQSLRFEAKLYESVQKKMEDMQTQGMSWIDVKFIKKVVDVLCRCRRTLMYTYAFAFFLKKNNHSMIFESNQSDLEQSTEQLSEFLDRELTAVGLNELKQKVLDKARYCETRRQVLLDHVHEGYEKDLWEQMEF